MIHIESRNIDHLRVEHDFETVLDLLFEWDSEDPAMGDNEVLLVVKDGMVLYSSLGEKPKSYNDTLRFVDLIDWFEGV